MPYEYKNTTLSDVFFKPILSLYEQSQNSRICHSISDCDFVILGIWRCLSQAVSGHNFIQDLGDKRLFKITVSDWFKALKSPRRLANLTSLNDLLIQPIKERITDPFAPYEELNDWKMYAVDGHYQQAACHDPIYITSKGTETHAATGHFFRIDLRNHHMSLLETSRCHLTTGKKTEHDMTIIKQAKAEKLRYDSEREQLANAHLPSAKKPKVMLVWDRACIDFMVWYKLSQEGVYFTTIEKVNCKLINQSDDRCDHEDERNEGIVSEHLVGNSNGFVLRRIIYINPTDGKSYTFITSDLSLPAYLIVVMYKHRWDIEKVYDEFKSKFQERKSWATTKEAKMAQAVFQCLLHNLALLMEQHIEEVEGIVDEIAIKQVKGRKRRPEKGFINKIVQRASQRTFRLIRWLRNWIHSKASYDDSLGRLYEIYTSPM